MRNVYALVERGADDLGEDRDPRVASRATEVRLLPDALAVEATKVSDLDPNLGTQFAAMGALLPSSCAAPAFVSGWIRS